MDWDEEYAEECYALVKQLNLEDKIISFNSIIAAGENGTILHYEENNSDINSDDLLLMDVGTYTKQYASDITRTFPINGKFTERQKQIYNIVLEANEMIIAAVKPGLTLRGLNTMVIEFYEKKLAENIKAFMEGNPTNVVN